MEILQQLSLVSLGSVRMLRVRIEYADQNESFRKMLPRRGTIVRTFPETSTGKEWSLLRLDEPFEWQHKIGEPFQFRVLKVDHLLVASRWIGVNIGGPEPAGAFIALVDEGFVPTGEALDIRQYVFIAWGMCYTERN
jgi:hypothetical protein